MGLRFSAEALKSVQDRLESLMWQGKPLTVFIGDPTQGAKVPYLFIHARPLPPESHSLDGGADVINVPLNVQVVENTPLNVLSLSDEVAAALEGFAPSANGWRFAPLRVEQASAVQTAATGATPATSRPPSWCTLAVRVRGSKYRKIGESVG